MRAPPFTFTPNGELVAEQRKAMKIRIVLEGSGGELDRQTIEIEDGDADFVSNTIKEAFDSWTLAPGDTIRIEELTS